MVNRRVMQPVVSGKASLMKRSTRGVQKISSRGKKKLKVREKTKSLLNLAQVSDMRVSRSKRDDDNDTLSTWTSSSTGNFSVQPYTPKTAGPSNRPPVSYVPLVIDSRGKTCGQPAFNITDENVDASSDAEVSESSVKKVKQVKRKRTRGATSTFVEVITKKEIQLFPVREWNLLIAVLPHPSTVKFVGPALIQAISGSVKILGYVLEQFHGIVPSFSSNKLMCLDIKTEHSESICRQASRLQIVRDALLQNKVPENVADEILNSCDNSSVIIGLRKNFKSSDVHFVSSLMPSIFLTKGMKNPFKPNAYKNFGFQIFTEDSTTLEFTKCENFVSDVVSSIKDCGEKGIPAPRIVVQGNKGLGKSTLLRYTINKVLNEFETVYYLDGDPGQSEFTPAGCVSLVKVTAPILGPPFTHQTTPEKMYFLGTVGIQDVPVNYSLCVKLLCDYYFKSCSSVPLFVNTMGWTVGLGLELLEGVKSHVSPTHLVKICDNQPRSSHSRARAAAKPTYSCEKEFTYQSFAPEDESIQLMNPAERRELSIFAYLGKCQLLYSSVRSFSSITPYCVPWKNLALYVNDQRYATDHLLYAFNGAWVALLSVDESLIMECDDPELPKLLSVEPVGQDCYGFGVIRAIDVAKKVFYIVTPEPKDRLKKVNALMKGSVQLPSLLYNSQKMKVQLPYVAEVVGESSSTSKHVSRRKFRPKKSQVENE